MNNNPIDFVIPWVDSNDPIWQKDYAKHSNNPNILSNPRFRDWGVLHYWFRSIEQYAPWVNKIHFITYGHIPNWLNTDHPKLNVVKHEDYIDSKYLPTFSSHVIELNMHRIKGLSENFVYFNDDTFLINPIDESFYFINNTPRDACIFDTIIGRGDFEHYLLNNVKIYNKYFNKKSFLKKNLLKVYNLKYQKHLFKNILLSPWKEFTGFANFHLPQPFNKSTLEKVWEKEKQLLTKVTSNKFRCSTDVNQYLFQIWQILEGNFYPKNINGSGLNITPIKKNFNLISSLFNDKKTKVVCINDTEEIKDFSSSKEFISSLFMNKLPKKSSFEL